MNTNSPIFRTAEIDKLSREDFRQAIRAEGHNLRPVIAQDRHPGAEARTTEIQRMLSECGFEEPLVIPE